MLRSRNADCQRKRAFMQMFLRNTAARGSFLSSNIKELMLCDGWADVVDCAVPSVCWWCMKIRYEKRYERLTTLAVALNINSCTKSLFSISILSHSSWQLYSKLSHIFNHPVFARVDPHPLCSEGSHLCVLLKLNCWLCCQTCSWVIEGSPENSSSHLLHQYHKSHVM